MVESPPSYSSCVHLLLLLCQNLGEGQILYTTAVQGFGVHQEGLCEEHTEVAVLLTTVPSNKMTKIVQKLKPVLINLVFLYICTFSFFLIANDKHSCCQR